MRCSQIIDLLHQWFRCEFQCYSQNYWLIWIMLIDCLFVFIFLRSWLLRDEGKSKETRFEVVTVGADLQSSNSILTLESIIVRTYVLIINSDEHVNFGANYICNLPSFEYNPCRAISFKIEDSGTVVVLVKLYFYVFSEQSWFT